MSKSFNGFPHIPKQNSAGTVSVEEGVHQFVIISGRVITQFFTNLCIDFRRLVIETLNQIS